MVIKNLPEQKYILEYKNAALLQYFCAHHSEINPAEAEQLLSDLMAWLWLNAYRRRLSKKTYLFGPLLILDELWHAFILHTRDYHAFCDQFFGEYIHHEIEPLGKEHEISPEELADFLSDAIDHLGMPWVLRYFPL